MNDKPVVSDKILKARDSQPWDYLRYGTIDKKGNVSSYCGACFSQVSGYILGGCEVFFDRSTPACIKDKVKKENHTYCSVMRDKFSDADIAYVNYLTQQSPWKEVYLNSPDDIMENGALYRTDRHNKFILEAAYLLRDVSEQAPMVEEWHKLAKLGYNPTTAMLFCQMYKKYTGYHTSISPHSLGIPGIKRIIAFDTDAFTKNTDEYMNKGKACIYQMENIWKGDATKQPLSPAPNTKGSFGDKKFYTYKGNPQEFEEWCSLNGLESK